MAEKTVKSGKTPSHFTATTVRVREFTFTFEKGVLMVKDDLGNPFELMKVTSSGSVRIACDEDIIEFGLNICE